MKSETDTIIAALRVLARDIQTDDGVVNAWNACIEEAAGRLEELQRELKQAIIEKIPPGYGLLNDQIKHLKEQIGYMQQALAHEIADGKKARDERDKALAEVERARKELAQAIAERTPHDYGLLKDEIDSLKRELTEAVRERNKTVSDLINQRDKAIASARQEPSRLEIAAMLLAAMCGSQYTWTNAEELALRKADVLIALAKEAK